MTCLRMLLRGDDSNITYYRVLIPTLLLIPKKPGYVKTNTRDL